MKAGKAWAVSAVVAVFTVNMAGASLVWHYEFNDNLDDSLGLNNATEVGTVDYISGPFSMMNAAEFAFGSYAEQQDLDFRSGGAGDFSVAYWSKITTPTQYEGPWVNYNTLRNGEWGDSGNFFGSEFKPEENRLVFGYGPPLETADANYITGEWKHHAFVYDSVAGQLLVYQDGGLSYTHNMTFNNNLNTYSTSFGPRYAGGTEVPEDWRMAMADVRWYDSALSESEVGTLVIPEPGTIGLMGLAGLVLLIRRRMRRG